MKTPGSLLQENPDCRKLRELATWYRRFAEQAGNATIWEARLQTADDLEAEAERIENIEKERALDILESDG